MRKTVAILGIPIDHVTAEEALARLEEYIQSGGFHQIATANTDFLVQALHDAELRRILRRSDMVVADGMPLVIASRWLKAPLPERVTGADLVPRLAERAAEKGYRVFMLGALPEVAAQAKKNLEKTYRGIPIVGCVSPPFGPLDKMDHEGLLRQIEKARPDILLVAFGNPKQEKWIAMHRERLQVPVCIGVGGTFDFIAGNIARAPESVQRSGFEWLYRLLQEPGRLWKRYAADIFHFSQGITRQLWTLREDPSVDKRRPAELKTETSDPEKTVLSVTGRLCGERVEAFLQAGQTTLQGGKCLTLDFQQTTDLDSAALGALFQLSALAMEKKQCVVLVGMRPRLQKMLTLFEMQEAFSRSFSNLSK